MLLSIIQEQLWDWTAHNFGDVPAWQPLLGIGEETGELMHAYLKREQDIRGSREDHDAEIEDAVGDIAIFLMDFCNKEGLDLQDVITNTWLKVRDRDWRPENTTHLIRNTWASGRARSCAPYSTTSLRLHNH
jgi:NTP pyrophosphatase (non-canonical NTP hydrolase)